MPTNFLTEDQRKRYGRFTGIPDEGQLAGSFLLDQTARRRAATAKGPRNRLGWAIQLGTLRYLGTFLDDPADVPAVVVDYVAEQLGLPPAALAGYGTAEHRWDHQEQIREAYGYRKFDFDQWFSLARWMYQRAWIGSERPTLLFDLATKRLLDHQVLLPGVTTLERLVSGIRERAEKRLWATLAAAPTAPQAQRLQQLVVVPGGRRISELDRLRRSPRDISPRGVVKALERYDALKTFGGPTWDLSAIPPGRIQALVRFARAARAQAVAELGGHRRLATLVAFAAVMPQVAADEAIEVFDLVMGDVIRDSATKMTKKRLRSLKDLDAAALLLRQAWLAVTTTAADPEGDIRAMLAAMDVAPVHAAADIVKELAQEPDDGFEQMLEARYNTIAKFLPDLLRHLDFHAGPDGQDVLDAVTFVTSLKGRRRPIQSGEAPTTFLSAAWLRRVFPPKPAPVGIADKRAYVVAPAEALRTSLHRHEIYVPGLRRWGDPNARLLSDDTWMAARPRVCEELDLATDADATLAGWVDRLDRSHRELVDGLAANPAVRIERQDGRDRIILTGLDRLEVPPSLDELNRQVDARLPSVDLPEMVLEVNSWVPYLAEFTHVSEAESRMDDLELSVAAVLTAEATNVGMEPIVHDGIAVLSRDRLFWVEQNYIRSQTLSRANARLVAFHTLLPLVQAWGGGELASADGLRFLTPVRTLNSGPNPKYFGTRRHGATFYNFLSDQFSGLHGILIPGTQRDSFYILDGLLEQETALRPVEVTSDTHGASEMTFGLFRLLGYQFSPRLADAGSATLYRADPGADYGPLNPLTRDRINLGQIAANWDDVLRVAGSLHSGTIKASEVLRVLAPGGKPTPTGKAIMEIGRLDRSAYLSTYFADELLRRRVNTQLNRQESRHNLARKIFHGQKGELRQSYREGQEDQLGALGLILNIVVLWNTVYFQQIIDEMRAEGTHVRNEDIARLSPLKFAHINFHGRYSFALPAEVVGGQLRSTRKPADATASD
ncbi:Tn3 family transposase [Pseudofrankia saprophytica]|uniref:Tn3 family transposase n=1 Tax=Pseudofrankia saprophytica TaxID=298655 RepID=UPI000234DBEF|nr:Tn3 family transposase [Pseudofrankia saprophytica]